MPDRRSGTAAARGRLARLVAVIGALVGLIVLQGAPCPDEFHALGHDPMCSTMTTIGSAGPALPDIVDDAGPLDAHGSLAPPSLPDLPTGVVELCLALLVAVLLVVIGLLRPGLLSEATPRARPLFAPLRRSLRAPRLAVLCVLRT
ncbi:hypothetical protein NQK81_28345 [Amycolatopsis roodepoortensis]|uniref:hypothetical protein n=1 Tax=Amycolatopsis roodepoortensis TaxID=700274 RepID=UPI00214CE876|nr:hypothetical protein [Amycolatopsis roodepoortensis]UUV28681.1 hypothetical protein NQK81_28345 [Amycolatopsis roodepoortensis]